MHETMINNVPKNLMSVCKYLCRIHAIHSTYIDDFTSYGSIQHSYVCEAFEIKGIFKTQ
jgi:hypothetical protein